jgi:hypothetical protein
LIKFGKYYTKETSKLCAKKRIMKHLLPLPLLLLPMICPAQWASFSTGSFNGFIVQFERFQDDLYACGLFNKIGGKNIDHLARWDGSE